MTTLHTMGFFLQSIKFTILSVKQNMTSVFTKYDVLLQSMTSVITKYMTCYYKVRQVLL